MAERWEIHEFSLEDFFTKVGPTIKYDPGLECQKQVIEILKVLNCPDGDLLLLVGALKQEEALKILTWRLRGEV
jgi:hypothetical protein